MTATDSTITDAAIDAALDTRLGLDNRLRDLVRGDTLATGYGKTEVVRALLTALGFEGPETDTEAERQALVRINDAAQDVHQRYPALGREMAQAAEVLCRAWRRRHTAALQAAADQLGSSSLNHQHLGRARRPWADVEELLAAAQAVADALTEEGQLPSLEEVSRLNQALAHFTGAPHA